MTVTAVVQARMGSTRLPGKVLADLGGRPQLAVLLERLAGAAVDEVVVATSDRPGDDPVAALARTLGRPVFRGSEADVLGRFAGAAAAYGADDVVRITADCPFTDPEIVDAVVARHRATGADYTSNTLLRTFPDGLDVEVLRAEALHAAAARATAPAEREHVTPHLYRHPEDFRLAALLGDDRVGTARWTVDTADDLARVRRVVAALGTTFRWEQALTILPPPPPPPQMLRPVLPGDGVPPPHDDPGRRTWSIVADGTVTGWIRCEVTAGTGHVVVPDGSGRDEADLLALLDPVLGHDLQVERVVLPSGSTAVWPRTRTVAPDVSSDARGPRDKP